MAKTLSGEHWKGFKPDAYFLGKRICECPVTEVIQPVGGKPHSVQTTLAEVFSYREQKPHIEKIEWDKNITIQTNTGNLVIEGRPLDGNFVKIVLELQQAGINMFETTWYWYNSDVCLDFGGLESFHFFIVHRDRIVQDDISLHYSDDQNRVESLMKSARRNPR